MADLMPDTCPLDSEVAPATSAEIVRLHDAGMGIDALGARFRLPYATIAAIVPRGRPRRAATAEAAARAHEGL